MVQRVNPRFSINSENSGVITFRKLRYIVNSRTDCMQVWWVSQGVVAEPRALALGILSGDQLDTARGLLQRQFAAQVGGKFRHAVGAHRRQCGIQVEAEQGTNFLERTGTQHGGEAAGDGCAQLGSRRVEENGREAPGGRGANSGLPDSK